MSKSRPLDGSALIAQIAIAAFVGFVAVCMFVGFGLWLYGVIWAAIMALPVVTMP